MCALVKEDEKLRQTENLAGWIEIRKVEINIEMNLIINLK